MQIKNNKNKQSSKIKLKISKIYFNKQNQSQQIKQISFKYSNNSSVYNNKKSQRQNQMKIYLINNYQKYKDNFSKNNSACKVSSKI